jgi:oligopeptidase B
MARKPRARRASSKKRAVKAPIARPRPFSRVVHGERLEDDYAWLRADNWRDVMRDPTVLDPEIRKYLEAENRYADQTFAKTATLRKGLIAEMRARIKEDDSTVPARDGGFSYYTRYRDGGQHPLFYRLLADGGDAELLLDGDALAQGKAYFQLLGAAHSPDHRLLGWSADDTGSELNKIRVRDLSTREDLADLVPDSTGGLVWTADSRAFFYVRLDAEHRPSRVFLHRLGAPVESDILVYEEPDKGFFVGIDRTLDGRFGVISCGDSETSEARLVHLADPTAPARLVAPRHEGVRYSVDHHPSFEGKPTLIIQTNADGAEDFKLVTAPVEASGRDAWRDLIRHRPGTFLLDTIVFRDWLVRLERSEGLPRIVVRRLTDRKEHTIAFDEEAYSLGVSAGFEFVTDTLRFNYSSMTTPTEVWDYDMGARTRALRKRQEVPSGHDPSKYVSRRLQAPTKDGETVPISLVYRRDIAIDGDAPCLLYGYGATAFPCPPRSAPIGFHSSTADSSWRSRIFAAAPKRAGAGTAKASSQKSKTASRILPPPRNT